MLIDGIEVPIEEILNTMPDLYFVTSPAGQIVFYCEGYEKLFGLTKENAKEVSPKIVHPDDIGDVLVLMGKAFQKQTTADFDYRLKLLSGKYHWFNVKMAPLKKDGALVGWVGRSIDVEESRSVLKTLQDGEKRKDDFIGMASHELKTPITSAKMLLQIVQRELRSDSKGKASPLLDKAEIQLNRLTRLTNDLLDVSKIKAGKLDLIKEVVNFDEFFCDAVQSLPSNHHKIDVKSVTKVKMSLDKGRIAQVLNNLIQNGIKYSPNAKRIVVRATSDGTKILVSVQDFGIGIPREKQADIFDRFYRVEEQVAESFSGLGLGLYIAAEIVHLHGGRIWVESKLNEGSTFYFTLPI